MSAEDKQAEERERDLFQAKRGPDHSEHNRLVKIRKDEATKGRAAYQEYEQRRKFFMIYDGGAEFAVAPARRTKTKPVAAKSARKPQGRSYGER